jgi:hypothetical protein
VPISTKTSTRKPSEPRSRSKPPTSTHPGHSTNSCRALTTAGVPRFADAIRARR